MGDTGKKKICVTGKYSKMSRAELKKVIEGKGYLFASSMTKDVSILLCSDPTSHSSKLDKARKLGIEVLSYDAFFASSAAQSPPPTPNPREPDPAEVDDDGRKEKLAVILGREVDGWQHVDDHYLIDNKGKNIFEWAIKQGQKGQSELFIQALLANVFGGKASDMAGDVFCPAFLPDSHQPVVIEYCHDEPYTWAYAADSFENLTKKLALNEAYEAHGVDEDDWGACYDELTKVHGFREKSPQDLLELIPDGPIKGPVTELVKGWLELGQDTMVPASYDFGATREVVELFVPAGESKGARVMAWLERARWICQLLDGSRIVSEEIPTGEQANENFRAALEGGELASDVSDALFWIVWSYLAGDEGDLEKIDAALKKTKSKLVKNCLATIKKVAKKGSKVGRVDLAEVRRANRVKFGIIDDKGQWVVEPSYSSMGGMACGLIPMKLGEKWGFVDTDGNEVISPAFDGVKELFQPIDGGAGSDAFAYAKVWLNGKEVTIGPDGDVLPYDFPFAKKAYEGDLFPIRTPDHKQGFVNARGEVIVEPQYNSVSGFVDGLATVYKDGSRRYIDIDGNEVALAFDHQAGPFHDGLACTQEAGKYGLIDEKGEEVAPCKYDTLSEFCCGLARVSTDAGIGYIDRSGREVIPLKRVWSRPEFVDGLALERETRETWTLIDTEGKARFEPIECEERAAKEGPKALGGGLWMTPVIGAMNAVHYLIVDAHGQVLNEDKLTKCEPCAGGKALLVTKEYVDGRRYPWQVWDRSCKPTHDGDFAEITPLSDEVFAVYQQKQGHGPVRPENQQVGLMNIDGEILLPTEYLRVVSPMAQDMVRVVDNAEMWGIYDCRKREWVVEPSLSWIGTLKELTAFNTGGTRQDSPWGVSGGRWGFIDHKGKIVIEARYPFIKSPMIRGRAVVGITI